MRKLCETDRERLLSYVGKEPEMNLFFIGDIENYGIDTEEVSLFVQEDEKGWDCVLLKFFDNYLIYSQKEQYQAAAAAQFLAGRTVDCISGKTELVKQLHPFYPELKVKETYMCRCGREDVKEKTTCQYDRGSISGKDISQQGYEEEQVSADAKLRRLTPQDVPQIMELYLQIEEFADSYRHPEKAKAQLEIDMQKGVMAVGVFEQEKLVSIAKTSADNSMSAMIVGVATAPEARKKGYASMAVQELCRQSFAEGKQFLCLFYDNPAAGRIYHRVGFKAVGSYAMMR